LTIRRATGRDRAAVWRVLEPTVRLGETYPLPHDLSEVEVLEYWFAPDHEVFVAIEAGQVAGTYYLRANQRGGGAHVANCGYITAPGATGRGIASAMCAHSLEQAQARGFRAMQFNFVVATNARAIALWQRFGFTVVGRIPDAFEHPRLGAVEALVMHRSIERPE